MFTLFIHFHILYLNKFIDASLDNETMIILYYDGKLFIAIF
jgi:hypothetical protein